MGMYVNPKSSFNNFKRLLDGKYFVDKSEVIIKFNELVDTDDRYVCITRPRRFGKTSIANMLVSYYSKEFKTEAKDIFYRLNCGKILTDKNKTIQADMIDKKGNDRNNKYIDYIGCFNTIHIDFSKKVRKFNTLNEYLDKISLSILKELDKCYKDEDITIDYDEDLIDNLVNINEEKDEMFVFIIDEWDYIFNNNLFTKKERDDYLVFLSDLLKGQGYVAFAYMTGVLPIAKHSSGSALNMFKESTMYSNNTYTKYLGFTDSEVKELCKKNGHMKYEDLASWYNGYISSYIDENKEEKKIRLFNPRSVIYALTDNILQSYWTETGPMTEIVNFMKNNVVDVKEDIVRMVAGESIEIKLSKFSAEDMSLANRKQILSAMVTYGFLTYYKGNLSIPNRELMIKFEDALEDKCMGGVSDLVSNSKRMLDATIDKDTSTMSAILEYTHDSEIPFLVYNNENSLSCVVTLAYLSARNYYDIKREDKGGKGFVDYIFYPLVNNKPIIILELKYGGSAKEAIEQIYEKEYFMQVRNRDKKSNILLVGINYDGDKNHDCIVEELDLNKLDEEKRKISKL